MYEFKSIEARYRTVWPALVTILFWRWSVGMLRSLDAAMPSHTWRRHVLTGLVGLVPALLLLTGYLGVIVLAIYWPIAYLQMLPTRIAIQRSSGQPSPILAPSFSPQSLRLDPSGPSGTPAGRSS